jgi:O-antigen/teichoic acid export membrane protein
MLNKIFLNIFSNWAFLILTILSAFIVSPILVQKLGDEAYGVWTLIMSLTGYFTLLDFGINTAIVRYISKYTAQNKTISTHKIFATAFTIFFIIGISAFFITTILGYFFKNLFNIQSFSDNYLFIVILILGTDLALNLTCGVFVATLRGLEKFLELNIINIIFLILKNSVLVYLLYNEHSLLSISFLIVLTTLVKHYFNYLLVIKFKPILKVNRLNIDKKALKLLINYSSYSIIIAVAIKIIFYTDSIVIASLISVSEITYYSIASMIVENMQNLVWAAIGVLIPVISANDASNKKFNNSNLYISGTRYTFIFITPIILVLIVSGDDFIQLWMGEKFSQHSGDVLIILLCGFLFSLSQLISHAILKGISKHKILAIILSFEAIFNLVLSLSLAPKYGIKGVAAGTTIPLIFSNLVLIPYFTCRNLKTDYFKYLYNSFLHPLIFFFMLLFLLFIIDITNKSFGSLIFFSFIIALLSWGYGFIFILEKSHKNRILMVFKTRRYT